MKEQAKAAAEKQSAPQATTTEGQPAVQATEGLFTREQFLSSAKYSHQDKDVLAALLEPGKLYTAAETQGIIDDFKNKEAE